MPIPAILTQVDTRLNNLLPHIDNIQNQERLRGRYTQLLDTHSAIPADGTLVSADRLTAHPTDQPITTSWAALAQRYGIALPSNGIASIAIDVYDGPSGKGYVLVVRIRVAGKIWVRRRNIGPETWRSTDWQEELTE